jgi:3-oxoacyl-[acyl-carrier protein] reductase
VLITYSVDEVAADTLKDEFGDFKDRFVRYKINQANMKEVHALIREIKMTIPYLNCIVCNTGKTVRKKFTDITDTEWNEVMNVSLNSHFILIRELFDRIARGSRILFMGSLMGIHPHAMSLAYGVSKAAVHALAKNLVKEFEGTETTVNAIVPGFVETDWQKEKAPEVRQNIYNKTAVKRFAAVSEVVAGCMFCIDNGFVNGSLLEISGGYDFK